MKFRYYDKKNQSNQIQNVSSLIRLIRRMLLLISPYLCIVNVVCTHISFLLIIRNNVYDKFRSHMKLPKCGIYIRSLAFKLFLVVRKINLQTTNYKLKMTMAAGRRYLAGL